MRHPISRAIPFQHQLYRLVKPLSRSATTSYSFWSEGNELPPALSIIMAMMASGTSGNPYGDDPIIENDLIEPDEGA